MPNSSLSYPIATAPLKGYWPPSPKLPDLTNSTPSTSSDDINSTSVSDDDPHEAVWEYVDSAYTYTRQTREKTDINGSGNGNGKDNGNEHGNGINRKWSSDLIAELDGATFGADQADPSTNRVPFHFPRPPDGGDYDIPHFPALTDAVLGTPGEVTKIQRTSGESSSLFGSVRCWLLLVGC